MFKSAAWSALALLFLYPLLWMALSSFKSSNVESSDILSAGRITSASPIAEGDPQGNLGSYFINSVWVTASARRPWCAWAPGPALLEQSAFSAAKNLAGAVFLGMILPCNPISFR